MVVVKYKMIMVRLIFYPLLIGCLAGFIVAIRDRELYWIFISIITSLFSMSMAFNTLPKYRFILDDYGITMKEDLYLLFYTYKKNIAVPWSAIIGIDYWGFVERSCSFVFHFETEEKLVLPYARLTCGMTNRKEALEYAIKKLSMSKFSEDAQKKLMKMGVISNFLT